MPHNMCYYYTPQQQQIWGSRVFVLDPLTSVDETVCLSSHPIFFPPVKATLSVVNVAALPDKGERLRTQVKELEDALESLSLTAASQPGNSLIV